MHIDDDTWAQIAPLIPSDEPVGPGRPNTDVRIVLTAIVYILLMNISWAKLPRRRFGTSGITCWRQFRKWDHENVWLRIERRLTRAWRMQGHLEWAAQLRDAASYRLEKMRVREHRKQIRKRVRRAGH
ncbi:transposase [Burkholderia contaminans]|uniref:transposase n=1 Tax=Burkholderia contaminans TaxID=488447 RepID=UPI003BF80638